VKPQVVSLPNLMFVGMARAIREELGVPVVCELTGEDIFLDAMRDRDRREVQSAIRKRTADVARFVATSDDYAGRMAQYLGLARDGIDVVYPGVPADYVTPEPKAHRAGGPPTVAYVARVCPEKGLHRLIDAMHLLQRTLGMEDVRLAVAGYVGRDQQRYYEQQRARVRESDLNGKVTFLGEVHRQAKLDVLDRSDVLCVPTEYAEAKGIYVLEALARGVPVVQPAHGSFPELIDRTGGGVLVPPGDAAALAKSLANLLADPYRRADLGRAGHAAVRDGFTDDHMARHMLKVFEGVTANAPSLRPAAQAAVAV
jgi:glycosyltransferase involved in cell wall biosynthesis